MIKFLVCILLTITSTLATADFFIDSGHHKRGQLNRNVGYFSRADGQFLYFQDLLLADHNKEIETIAKITARLEPAKNIYVVVSSFYGGSVISTNNLFSGLRSVCPKESCKITVYVLHECSSACLDFLMMADQRIVNSGAQFGFHKGEIGKRILGLLTVGHRESKEQFLQHYVDIGLDPDWLKLHLDYLTMDDDGVYVDSDAAIAGRLAQAIDPQFLKNLGVTYMDFYQEPGSKK